MQFLYLVAFGIARVLRKQEVVEKYENFINVLKHGLENDLGNLFSIEAWLVYFRSKPGLGWFWFRQ